MRRRFAFISFHDEPNRDYVLTMNVLLAAFAGAACALYAHTDWWSIAIGVGALAVLELALRWRATAWLSIAIGVAASAGAGAVLGMSLAAGVSDARAALWAGAAVGALAGGAIMVDAHRKLRIARHQV